MQFTCVAGLLNKVFQSRQPLHDQPPRCVSTDRPQAEPQSQESEILAVDDWFNPPYHADILHTAAMFNPVLLNRLEAIRSERITVATLCETEMRLNHILCWSDTRLESAEGSRRGQPFSEAETCKCTDSRDKSSITEKTIMERGRKKRAEWNRKGIRWMEDGPCGMLSPADKNTSHEV